MRLAAKYAGVRYKDFCHDYKTLCEVNMLCSVDFGYDWVNVMTDPYSEASGYGLKLTFPENDLPQVSEFLIKDINDIDNLRVIKASDHDRMKTRVMEIGEFSRLAGNTQFICGWVEGPLAEYCDLRNVSVACMDLYENPEKLKQALEIITQSALGYITEQVKAGAHCIGIGDAVCSLISPDLYQEFVFPLEKVMVDHAHSLNARVKLHICGDTTGILPDMIRTGADIIDIDHLVTNMGDFMHLFKPKQIPSGNSNPVSVIRDGNCQTISERVAE
jgi:uroporphyrinogen-III decarboxylase